MGQVYRLMLHLKVCWHESLYLLRRESVNANYVRWDKIRRITRLARELEKQLLVYAVAHKKPCVEEHTENRDSNLWDGQRHLGQNLGG